MPSIQARIFNTYARFNRFINRRTPHSLEKLDHLFTSSTKLLPTARGIAVEQIEMGGRSAEYLVHKIPSPNQPIMLYLHGGGHCIGSPRTHRTLTSHIAKGANCRVFAPTYRLAPAHPFPAALDDCLSAYRWLLSEGHAPERIIVGGDSAGGNLTLALLQSLREADDPLPAGAVLISPATDLVMTGMTRFQNAGKDVVLQQEDVALFAQSYLGDTDPHNPLVSPLYADVTGFPPLLLQAGSAEILLDDSIRLNRICEEAGIDITFQIWDDMVHDWHLGAFIMPEARDAVREICDFIKRTAN